MVSKRTKASKDYTKGDAMTLTPAHPMEREKRNIYISGKRTSLLLETYIWRELDRLSLDENITLDEICTSIDQCRDPNFNLTTVIRYLTMKVHTLKDQSHHRSPRPKEMAEAPMAFPSAFYKALENIRDLSHANLNDRPDQNS
jgi:predicted DNA-binding ribbon-helix-helix protein